MYWNLIWKSPGFVPFGDNLVQLGGKSDITGSPLSQHSGSQAVLGCSRVFSGFPGKGNSLEGSFSWDLFFLLNSWSFLFSQKFLSLIVELHSCGKETLQFYLFFKTNHGCIVYRCLRNHLAWVSCNFNLIFLTSITISFLITFLSNKCLDSRIIFFKYNNEGLTDITEKIS